MELAVAGRIRVRAARYRAKALRAISSRASPTASGSAAEPASSSTTKRCSTRFARSESERVAGPPQNAASRRAPPPGLPAAPRRTRRTRSPTGEPWSRGRCAGRRARAGSICIRRRPCTTSEPRRTRRRRPTSRGRARSAAPPVLETPPARERVRGVVETARGAPRNRRAWCPARALSVSAPRWPSYRASTARTVTSSRNERVSDSLSVTLLANFEGRRISR